MHTMTRKLSVSLCVFRAPLQRKFQYFIYYTSSSEKILKLLLKTNIYIKRSKMISIILKKVVKSIKRNWQISIHGLIKKLFSLVYKSKDMKLLKLYKKFSSLQNAFLGIYFIIVVGYIASVFFILRCVVWTPRSI
jgi:hypothetical protein